MAEGRFMLLRKGGKAIHQLGDISRDTLDAELIVVGEEDEENYIGRFAEGFGFCHVKFAKQDCRDITPEELELWKAGKGDTIKF